MTPWTAAALALLPPLAIALWHTLRGGLTARLVAVQLAAGLTSLIIVLMSFAFDQPSIIDLALALGFLSLPGTLLLALFTERWL
jgi:multicomponent Na+:H+ antiporter subunit F